MRQLGLIDTFFENTSILFYNDFFKIPQNINTNIYWKLDELIVQKVIILTLQLCKQYHSDFFGFVFIDIGRNSY